MPLYILYAHTFKRVLDPCLPETPTQLGQTPPKISRFRTCRSSVSLASLRAHAALHQSFRSSHKSMKAAGFISVFKESYGSSWFLGWVFVSVIFFLRGFFCYFFSERFLYFEFCDEIEGLADQPCVNDMFRLILISISAIVEVIQQRDIRYEATR